VQSESCTQGNETANNSVDKSNTNEDDDVVGTKIPTVETVPLRKTSLIQPDVASKLSPQPHLHHSPVSPVLPMELFSMR